jgi:acyl-CoA thioester hydrolase
VWGAEFEGRPAVRAAHGRYVTVHVPQDADGARPWPQEWRDALT